MGKWVQNHLKNRHEKLVREEARLEAMKKDEDVKYEALKYQSKGAVMKLK